MPVDIAGATGGPASDKDNLKQLCRDKPTEFVTAYNAAVDDLSDEEATALFVENKSCEETAAL